MEEILLAIGSKALPTFVENAASGKIAIAQRGVQPEWREDVGTSVRLAQIPRDCFIEIEM